MAKGTIKRLVRDRGFGFIKTEEEGDLFFHSTDLQGVAYEVLAEGQKVEFEVKHTPKGPRAVTVRPIGETG